MIHEDMLYSNEYEKERQNRMLHLQQAAMDGLEAAIAACQPGTSLQEVQNILIAVAANNGVRFLQQQSMIRLLARHPSHFNRDLTMSSNNNIKDQYIDMDNGWKWLEGAATSKMNHFNPARNQRDEFEIPERLQSGMVINLRPIYVEGHYACAKWANGWTSSTVDGGLAAQAEATILINNCGEAETF